MKEKKNDQNSIKFNVEFCNTNFVVVVFPFDWLLLMNVTNELQFNGH